MATTRGGSDYCNADSFGFRPGGTEMQRGLPRSDGANCMKRFFLSLLGLTLLGSASFAQNVTVNPGAGSYATLQAAFAAINAGTHTGAVSVTIVNNTTETGTAVLNASGSGSASYTSISIQ